jgi:tRNA threonylcarbamoyladenosine biosynthesis protein TsaB
VDGTAVDRTAVNRTAVDPGMNVLGIETATELIGVAVATSAGERAGSWASGRRRHAECLAPAIVHVLDQVGLGPRSLDVIAVDTGPGLFTGLRVGVATAKGLAQGLGVGVVGVGSLIVLARAALDAGRPGMVVPVVDARRGEVFAARYRPGPGPFGLHQLDPPRVLRPAALAAEVARMVVGGDPVVMVGDGSLAYAGLFADTGATVAGALLSAPPPDTLVTLAIEHLATGGGAVAPERVGPEYLRAPDARINWQQRSSTEGAALRVKEPR